MKNLNLTNIAYFRASESYSILVGADGHRSMISWPLKKYAPNLEAQGWCRIHRSYMVNPHYVKGISECEDFIFMLNGAELPIARRKKREVFKNLQYAKAV